MVVREDINVCMSYILKFILLHIKYVTFVLFKIFFLKDLNTHKVGDDESP